MFKYIFLQFAFIFKSTFGFAPKLRIEKLSGRNFGAFFVQEAVSAKNYLVTLV